MAAMHVQVMYRQREAEAVAKCAHAACVAAERCDDGGGSLSAFLASRGSPLEAALQKRLDFHGPSGTEVWLMGLSEAEVAEVVAMAEWAIERARAGGWISAADADVDIAGPEEGLWRWHRARLAVDPEHSYSVLGRVLNMPKALALPFERRRAMVPRGRGRGGAAGVADGADAEGAGEKAVGGRPAWDAVLDGDGEQWQSAAGGGRQREAA